MGPAILPILGTASRRATRPSNRRRSARAALVAIALFAGLVGCARRSEPVSTLSLIERLSDFGTVARVEETVRLFSSSDPIGNNEDYGHFLGDGPPGWKVMADTPGPGYLSRFWFTGAPDGRMRLRFYFDDEEHPRIETTLEAWCGGVQPATPPLAGYENYAWYSFLPIPFARRLVVMCEAAAAPPDAKLFFQLQIHRLPRGAPVESFCGVWSDDELRRLAAVRDAWRWRDAEEREDAVIKRLREEMAGVPTRVATPGDTTRLADFKGSAVISAWALELDAETLPDAAARAAALRDLVLEMTWDGLPAPSVAAPLGLFFGGWRYKAAHATALWRVEGWRFICRWPMFFRRSARLELRHRGSHPVRFRWAALTTPEDGCERPGYFHAEYRRSGPAAGTPHLVVAAQGEGVYRGCVLDVAAADDSGYWLLEGDEMLKFDGERRASWRGTGLEDYFNGGWYYQNVVARPLHGVTFKAPFRVTQYRVHALDRVPFRRGLEMSFERGPRHATPGWMESVAFYYLRRPMAVSTGDLEKGDPPPPPRPYEPLTIMTELWNLERLGEFDEAADHAERFLARSPEFSRREMLELRKALYRAEASGNAEAAIAAMEAARASPDSAVRRAAEDGLWLEGAEHRALVFLYANNPATLHVNGVEVLHASDATIIARARVELNDAPRVIAIAARRGPYPDWVLAVVRTARADYVTTPSWRVRAPATRADLDPATDSSSWPRVGGTGVKGPPEEPFLWVEPDPFLGVVSGAVGLRAPAAEATAAFEVVFRWDATDSEASGSVRPRAAKGRPGREADSTPPPAALGWD